MPQFIYTMKGLGKMYPPDSQVLKDIWLSFFPGAKIGVLGFNGSGKSTLLRIMAGLDHDFVGEAVSGQRDQIGHLSQEPQLDPAKTVPDIVEEGVAEMRALLKRFDEINEKFAQDLSPEEMDKVLAEQARVQDQIDAADAWELDRSSKSRWTRCGFRLRDVEVKTLSGGERRRVALCRLLLQSPDLLLLDEPTNHLDAESVAWLERFLQGLSGTVVAVTHDRYFLDNVAGWILELDRGSGIPWEGNYSSWLEQKQKRLAARGEDRVEAAANARARARVGAHGAPSPTGEEQGPPQGVRRMLAARIRRSRSRTSRSTFRRPAAGRSRRRGARSSKAYGDKLLFDDLTSRFRAAASSASSDRTAPARRRCSG